MRAETQGHIEKIRKSLDLLGQRMGLRPRSTGWRNSTPASRIPTSGTIPSARRS
jgi:hypothetical protein